MLAAAQSSPWPAPAVTHPIHATVRIPGSKSMTNRALILAALAASPSTIEGALLARDSQLAITALRQLGADVAVSGTTVYMAPLAVSGSKAGAGQGAGSATFTHVTDDSSVTAIDCGLAGTVMRFLPPVAALTEQTVRLDGDPRARLRPLAPLTAALRTLGVQVSGDHLPITIRGTGAVVGGAATLDSSTSSQFVSGLLLAAARFEQGVRVTHRGPALPSLPHIQMTVAMLAERGVRVESQDDNLTHCHWRVAPGPIAGGTFSVEPDLSNAGPFLAAAMVTGGTVRIPGWPRHTWQAGDALREIFAAMGAQVVVDHDGLTLIGPVTPHGIDQDFSAVGELVPTVAAVAALADGPSRLRGIGHLRGHETDRLAALGRELQAFGCQAEVFPDSLAITPGPLQPGVVECYADHRMATFGAIIGLRVPGTHLSDVSCTTKTLPDFAELWTAMVTGG